MTLYSPESAETTSFTVQEGDVIILGTDGLFDNMKDEMIVKHILRLKVRRLWSEVCFNKYLSHALQ